MRILIAEDSETIRLLLRRRLELEGHEVVEARDGEQAVAAALAAHPPYDAMLLDVSMPRRSGLDALAELRAAGCPTPAIVLSAHHPETEGLPAAADGAVAWIEKPIDWDRLLAALDSLAGGGAAGG